MTRPSTSGPRGRRLGPSCLSDLRLDQLALGELGEGERAPATAHLAACAACRAAADGLEADRRAFAAETPFASLAAATLARAEREAAGVRALRWWRGLLPGAGLAAGLAAAAFVLLPDPGADEPRQGFTSKGGFSISAVVKHAESAAAAPELHAGEALHERDRLQLRLTSTEAGHVVVVALDEARRVSVYYPPGPRSDALAAARDQILRTAVELDATLGREVIVAVRCPQPVGVEQVAAAARRALGDADGALARIGPVAPAVGPGCVEARYEIRKEK
jgi:hypothetical protein